MATRSRKRPLSVHDYLFPHKKNGYTPHLFRTASVSLIVLGVFALQAAYFAQVKLVFPKTDFLASVLPGALVSLTNSDRASNDLGAVTEDGTLDQAAQAAANDMAAKGYFAHVSPDGKDPWYWLKQAGYDYEYAGENLAVNFTDSDQVETAWMNSPTHRANILKSQYTKVGIGVANGTYEGKEATFVVQFFATPESAAAIPAETPHQTGTPAQNPVQQATPAKSGSGEIAVVPHSHPAPASQVLGTQASNPSATPVASAPVASSAHTTTAAPLAHANMAKSPTGFLGWTSEVITSPTHTLLYILLTLSGFVMLLLFIELSIKMRMRYVEVTGGGLALLLLLIAFIIFNVASAPKVQLAPGVQQATTQTS